MHGLKTINELNRLAVENSPEFVKEQLTKAEIHKGEPKLHQLATDAIATRTASREAAIAALSKETFEDLIARVEALGLPSTLEAALARKLKSYLAKFGQHSQD